jgi:hypothetical protein
MKAARKATHQLLAWCKIPDGGNPEIYLAGVVGILAQYPLEVMERIANPITGSALLPDYPSLQRLRSACEKAYEPMRWQKEREASRAKMLPAWDKKLTEEERARRAVQVEDWRKRMTENLQPEPMILEASNATASTTTTTEESESHVA